MRSWHMPRTVLRITPDRGERILAACEGPPSPPPRSTTRPPAARLPTGTVAIRIGGRRGRQRGAEPHRGTRRRGAPAVRRRRAPGRPHARGARTPPGGPCAPQPLLGPAAPAPRAGGVWAGPGGLAHTRGRRRRALQAV